MKLVLIQDVPKVGRKNEIVDAADGYAKNYLIPRKLAEPYTSEAMKNREERLKVIAIENENIRQQSLATKSLIEATELNFELKSNNGKAFGSISNKMIHTALEQNKINLPKHAIELEHPLGLGVHEVKITLPQHIIAIAKIKVREAK